MATYLVDLDDEVLKGARAERRRRIVPRLGETAPS